MSPPAGIRPDAAQERARWTLSAPSWAQWADPLAAFAEKLNAPLLDAAGLERGHRVLDLACGVGEPALSAARRVGPEGTVLALDLVPAMLVPAARRAAAMPPPHPRFAAADMAALPVPDRWADAVTCRFGIMFAPDAVRALREARRALKPNGRAAFLVWGPQTGNTLLDVLDAALTAVLGEDPANGLAPLFRYAEPGSLGAQMRAAGFDAVEETALTPSGRVPLDRPFWQAQRDMAFSPRLNGLPPDLLKRIDAEIAARFRALAVDGACRLDLHARIVAGVA